MSGAYTSIHALGRGELLPHPCASGNPGVWWGRAKRGARRAWSEPRASDEASTLIRARRSHKRLYVPLLARGDRVTHHCERLCADGDAQDARASVNVVGPAGRAAMRGRALVAATRCGSAGGRIGPSDDACGAITPNPCRCAGLCDTVEAYLVSPYLRHPRRVTWPPCVAVTCGQKRTAPARCRSGSDGSGDRISAGLGRLPRATRRTGCPHSRRRSDTPCRPAGGRDHQGARRAGGGSRMRGPHTSRRCVAACSAPGRCASFP